MTDRPIIFSAPMVRALLDGRKMQTRRVFIPPAPFDANDDITVELATGSIAPKWQRGDRLWVREGWQAWTHLDRAMAEDLPQDARERLNYPADGNIWNSRKRPSIHMPRWASRLTLAVTDVRVERLQDISEGGAEAEGVETDVWDMAPVAKRYGTDGWFVGWPMGVSDPSVSVDAEQVCRRSFASLWNSIHGPEAWAANPYVGAISFTVHRANIDALDVGEAA